MEAEEGPRTEEALQVEGVGEGIQVKEGEEGVEVVGLICQLRKMVEGEVQPARPAQHGE